MSDLNDFSDKDSFYILCNNEDQLNSSYGDVDMSDDEHRPEIILPQSDPPIFKSLSKNLLDMAEKLKLWSSKFFVRDGDKMIDVSSAAQGPNCLLSFVVQHKHNKHNLIQELHIGSIP
jgi:hypothetical protein